MDLHKPGHRRNASDLFACRVNLALLFLRQVGGPNLHALTSRPTMRELLLRTGIASASCVLLVPARARAYEQKPPVSRVILIRHGESEGNVNFDIYRSTPDARIHLTQKGWTQAHEAGRSERDAAQHRQKACVQCASLLSARRTAGLPPQL